MAEPDPGRHHQLVDASDVAELKKQVLATGLTVSQLVSTAWASARRSAAATSAAARTVPGSAWSRRAAGRSTTRTSSRPCCAPWRGVQQAFNAGGKQVSLADLIVLAGTAGVEQAARNAGYDIEVPFTPGRADASRLETTSSRSPR